MTSSPNRAFAAFTSKARLKPIRCGGEDPISERREQWTDGANAFAVAAKTVQDASAKEATHAELAAAAKQAATTAKLSLDDVNAAKKLAQDTAVSLQQANEKFANTQKTAGAIAAAAAEAQKKIAAAQAAAKPAIDASNAAKATVTEAVKAVETAKAKWERMKAVNSQAKK